MGSSKCYRARSHSGSQYLLLRGGYLGNAALVAVGREASFTKAAGRLGVLQSVLSQTVRQLEARLGVRLLTRTTRSVWPTAGERLIRVAEPRFEEIEAEVEAVAELRDTPVGSIRITATDYATAIWATHAALVFAATLF